MSEISEIAQRGYNPETDDNFLYRSALVLFLNKSYRNRTLFNLFIDLLVLPFTLEQSDDVLKKIIEFKTTTDRSLLDLIDNILNRNWGEIFPVLNVKG